MQTLLQRFANTVCQHGNINMKYSCWLAVAMLFASCSKDPKAPNPDCDALKQGLLNEEVSVVTSALATFSDLSYSQENINALADTINRTCDVKASVLCFECVQTLPPETEMYFALTDNTGDSTARWVDITYTTDNKIRFVAVHK